MLFQTIAIGLFSLSAFIISVQSAQGDLDSTFGSGGKVTYRFNEREDTFQGVVIQTDGKIVAAGNNGQRRLIMSGCNPSNTINTDFICIFTVSL
jgi:hypothetical protein